MILQNINYKKPIFLTLLLGIYCNLPLSIVSKEPNLHKTNSKVKVDKEHNSTKLLKKHSLDTSLAPTQNHEKQQLNQNMIDNVDNRENTFNYKLVPILSILMLGFLLFLILLFTWLIEEEYGRST